MKLAGRYSIYAQRVREGRALLIKVRDGRQATYIQTSHVHGRILRGGVASPDLER